MSIKPNCDKCGKELNDFGAILLSPPAGLMVKKYHICKECYKEMEKELNK
jgi:hypothetical protein